MIKIINSQLLDQTTAKAKTSPRLRMNYNFHDNLDDPINRLLNAMEPDTYLRPHRHLNPDKNETFLLLRGKVALFIFDDHGNIIQTTILDPLNGIYGGEIPPHVWHGLLVLQTGSVIYEIKQGPFSPLAPENLAPWSPEADHTKAVKIYIQTLKQHLETII